MIRLRLPERLDTSLPIILRIRYYVDSTATGNWQLVQYVSQIKLGNVLDGSLPISSTTSYVTTIATNSNKVWKELLTSFTVEKLIPGDTVVIKLNRDASGTNPLDTLAASVVITGISAVGRKWRP